ncbi:integrating conjugative element protein [Exercitatus varius]|uniref:integrating conjugative element protein n=1 Tax=Exercitatus varius TaxID=67857 RepID=UPI00294AFCA1|nr:integrating conjugative element protein [Exercitatus varius]MDG2961720.1 integrating conjugative element protein [Exercitatus varius]
MYYIACFFVIILSSGIATAELNVIADLGGESAVRFYEGIQPEHDDNAIPQPHALPAKITEADMLPVVSHKLSPGVVQQRILDLPAMQPIFLLGADPISARWLATNVEKLKNTNAMGLVVNVKTLDELNGLRAIAPGITLLPSSADDLAERIQLSHYPVLLTATGLSQ